MALLHSSRVQLLWAPKVWLMESLALIAPPENMESYNNKGFSTRKRLYERKSADGWVKYFTSGEIKIRWVVKWWHIRRMICSGSAAELKICGLRTLTFFFPTRILRQYGRRQCIPTEDTKRPATGAMVGGAVSRWEDYWKARPKLDVLDLGIDGWRVSRHYLRWINSNDPKFKADARIAEREKMMSKKRDREESSELGIKDSSSKGSGKSTTSSVKDRLGRKVAPVWDRLSGIKFNESRAKKPKTDNVPQGKGKEVIVEKKKTKKKYVWKKKDDGSGSSKDGEKKEDKD